MKKNKNSSFFKSLRFRIIMILVVVGLVPCIFATRAVISNYEERAIANRSQNVRQSCEILASLLIRENYLYDTSSQTANGKLELLANIYGGRILVVDRDFRIVKDTYNIDTGKTLVSPSVIRCFRGEASDRYDREGEFIQMAVAIKSPDVTGLQGALLINVSTAEIRATIWEMEQRSLFILAIIMLLSATGSFFLSKILVKPFSRVTKSIEDLTDGYQYEALPVQDYTETALIIDAFNKILRRMKVLDDSRQEFVSNVSHELKTPMTSMKVLADSLLGQEDVPAELYKEFLQDITQEIDRENSIITDLLALVKLDKNASDLHIVHMNINHLLEVIIKRVRPIANVHNIEIFFDAKTQVDADVDEVKFTLAITNLVENGVKYNVDEGWVRVTLDADHDDFFVTVADSGMGIPKESLEKIFERFYRVDKSHSREIGGTGLGLSITRSAVAMHHGIIRVESEEGQGAVFTVRIPLFYTNES